MVGSERRDRMKPLSSSEAVKQHQAAYNTGYKIGRAGLLPRNPYDITDGFWASYYYGYDNGLAEFKESKQGGGGD